MTQRTGWIFGALLLMSGLSGCVVRSHPVEYVPSEGAHGPAPGYAEVYVAQPPPPPVVEYATPPPGHGYVWLQGYWDWTGYDWYWTPGYWTHPRPGYVYVSPRYVRDGGRWRYHRSHWMDGRGR